MGKNAKKAPIKAGKPITDFFTRIPSSSQGSSSTASSRNKVSKTPSLVPATRARSASFAALPAALNESKLDDLDALALSGNPSGLKSIMEASVATSSETASNASKGAHHLALPVKPLTRRSRSPAVQFLAPPSQKSSKKPPSEQGSRSPTKRKAIFDSDSDTGHVGSVVYVKAAVRLSSPSQPLPAPPLRPRENLTIGSVQVDSRKKPRISPPEVLGKTTLDDLVPSSQSDEEELAAVDSSSHNHDATKNTADHWKMQALPPSPDSEDDGIARDAQMDVDDSSVLSSPLSSSFPASEAEISAELKTAPTPARSTTPSFDHILTPPLTDYPSDDLPIPAALDSATKAADIIANIRAKCAAAASSPEDSSLPEFKDELDDSSDEDEIVILSVHKGKGKSTDTTTNDINPIVPSQPYGSHSRYALRNHAASTSPSESNAPSTSRRRVSAPHKGPVILTAGLSNNTKATARKKRPTFDPLDELLREKKLANQRGQGDEAFHLAESAASRLGKNSLFDEMDEESFDVDTNLDDLPWRVKRDRPLPKSSPARATSDVNIVLREEDRKRLFGEEGGKGIMNILQSDKEKKEIDMNNMKVAGLPLWKEFGKSEDNMVDDKGVPVLNISHDRGVLEILRSAVECGDYQRASLVMDSGVLATVEVAGYPDVISYLCKLALFEYESKLSLSAFHALLHIWGKDGSTAAGIQFSSVLYSLQQLGADPLTLTYMHWVVNSKVHPRETSQAKRGELLYRLTALLSISASRLMSTEIPDFVMALILIAMDPSSSQDLQQDIAAAINVICISFAPPNAICLEIETAICNKLLQRVLGYSAVNQAFLLSFLGQGSGRTRRIARWVAHSIITDTPVVSTQSYCDLPPLSGLLTQLMYTTSPDSEEKRGKLELHDKTDYVNLGFHVYILSVAITNVKGYVEEERKINKTSTKILRPPDSSSKSSSEKADAELQLLREELEGLHSRISDTRAAHLDRSRAKAAVKALSMRVHYQRLAMLRSGGGDATGKPRQNIRQYFASKS